MLWNISNRDISITIEVDENVGEVDPGSQDRRYSVHGVVTGVDGRELADAEVTVWRQRIRSRVRLVTGRTSEEGSYRLSYRPPPDDVPSKLLAAVTTERLDTADRSSARSCFRSGCVDYVRVPARTAPGQLGAGRIENRDPRDRRHFATRAFKRLHRRRSMPVF